MSSWHRVVALILLSAAVVLGACAGDDGADDSAPASTEVGVEGTPTAEQRAPEIDPEAQRWEAAVCPLVREFRTSFLAPSDGVDPHVLTVRERQARSDRLFPDEIAVASEALTRIEAVEPPEHLARLHGALESGYRLAVDAITERRAAVAAASTAEEIDRANPPARTALDAALRFEQLLQQGGYCLQVSGTS